MVSRPSRPNRLEARSRPVYRRGQALPAGDGSRSRRRRPSEGRRAARNGSARCFAAEHRCHWLDGGSQVTRRGEMFDHHLRAHDIGRHPGSSVWRRRTADGRVGCHVMSKRPRLCMVVHGYLPLDPRVLREARAARAAGWDVDVVAIRSPGEASVEISRWCSRSPAALRHRRGGGLGRLSSIRRLHGRRDRPCWVCVSASDATRVVQVHNPPDFLVVAAIIPKLFGARLLFDVHDLSSDMFDMRFRGRRAAVAHRALLGRVRAACNTLADAVITVHEPYKAELRSPRSPSGKNQRV